MRADRKIHMNAARVDAGLTQSDVAAAMKLNKATIVKWETGKITPKPAQFEKYCQIVGYDKDEIFLPE